MAAAGALRAAGPDTTAPSARLKTISARVGSKGASLTIEASEPVGYSLTRPDATTVLVDFRNVTMADVANTVVASANSPIANVLVEPYESMGAPASRVRIVLARPVTHRVRSERNTVIVEFEKASAKSAPYVTAPAVRDAMAAVQASLDGGQSGSTPPAATVDPIEALGLSSTPLPVIGTMPPAKTGSGAAPRAPASSAAGSAPTLPRRPRQRLRPQSQRQRQHWHPQRLPRRRARRKLRRPSRPTPEPRPPRKPRRRRRSPRSRHQPARWSCQPGRRDIGTSGHPVSLDFQGADLRAVLRTFAEISGLNIVIDPAVTGTVDVALRDVPWDQALDIILRANKLGYTIDGTIVRICAAHCAGDGGEGAQRAGEGAG